MKEVIEHGLSDRDARLETNSVQVMKELGVDMFVNCHADNGSFYISLTHQNLIPTLLSSTQIEDFSIDSKKQEELVIKVITRNICGVFHWVALLRLRFRLLRIGAIGVFPLHINEQDMAQGCNVNQFHREAI